MTVPSVHLLDILGGRKLSSFLLFEDSFPLVSCFSIWPTLCKRLCEQYTCLIVRSELPGSPLPSQLPSTIQKIDFWDFPCALDCLKEVGNRVSTTPPDSPLWVIFFENMDAFLMDCPSDHEIGNWASLILSHLLSFATNHSIASVICSLNIYKAPNVEITSSSEQVRDIFESYATTCVRLTPTDNRNILEADFWHRRTLDSICKSVRLISTLAPHNKPAVSGLCQITLDPKTRIIVSCSASTVIEKVKEPESLPTSTFKLTASQTEIEAKQKVVLPYHAAVNTSVDPSTLPLPESTIDYVPDVFDDIDEDDPDDDLDI
ncbi:hypothetical protein EGR_07192 [Echinococcus granulosus]|uniref:Elongator complex protein 5 n=1 Tax=Echinococcus granulosus TaxID=6210 RepID=W6UIJ2_ECHGR|nr:hypothetical protein EGR_07192 [Echinococcus granulosus]EUB57922.1 hypothetical protein EGR_07192 [Echinococcus granulosus]